MNRSMLMGMLESEIPFQYPRRRFRFREAGGFDRLMRRVKNAGQKTAEAKAARQESKVLAKKNKATRLAKNPHNKSPLIAAFDKSRLKKKVSKSVESVKHKVENTPDPRPRKTSDERVSDVVGVPISGAKKVGKVAIGAAGAYGLYRAGKLAHAVYKNRKSSQAVKSALASAVSKSRINKYHVAGAAGAGAVGLALLRKKHDKQR